uniref:Uncharacterized protein n=1 Tax=Haemonchus contortus TaxID=6289 RepID=A0A7I4Y4M4_HAECO
MLLASLNERGSGLPLQEIEDEPPARWSYFFTKALNDSTALPCVPEAKWVYCTSLTRDGDEWRRDWRSVSPVVPLEETDDQRYEK